MKAMVDLLNATRGPSCGTSIFHNWVENLHQSELDIGKAFGWGSSLKGTECTYTWPNEDDNTAKGGINVDAPGATPDNPNKPIALPTQCESVPIFLNDKQRQKLSLTAYFVPPFMSVLLKKLDPNTRQELNKLIIQLTNIITSVQDCPDSPIQCEE
jgi:hypothetical protein